MAGFGRRHLDVVGFARSGGEAAVQLFTIRDGRTVARDVYLVENAGDGPDEDGLDHPLRFDGGGQFFERGLVHLGTRLVLAALQLVNGQGGEGGDGTGEGQGDSFDDHSQWGDNAENLDPGLRELAKERLREMMRNAADEANKSSNGWGSVTHNIRKDIMDRISGKIDWRSVLRYFIKTSQRAAKTSTVKRINKRYAYIHPGQKVQRHAKIAISIDQSGSVSDEMLEAFFSELNNLAKIATFTVVPFDTEVDPNLVYTWKKGMKRKKERVKYGGTDFDAPTKYVNDKGFDGHIVLTDMQAPKPIVSKCQRMWMTTKDCLSSMPFKTHERVIAVE